MKKFISFLVLLIGLVLVSGCGGGKSIKTEGGTLNVNENKLEVKTNDGKAEMSVGTEGQEVALPEGYPQEVVPILAGAKITLASRNEDANKKLTYWVTVTSDKNAQEVRKFYEGVLKDAQNTQKTEVNKNYFIAGEKQNNIFTVTVTAEETGGKRQSNIQIMIAPKE